MKKIMLSVIVLLGLLVVGIVLYQSKPAIKGYDIPKIGKEVKLNGTKNGESYDFHTYIDLSSSSTKGVHSYLNIYVHTRFKKDEATNTYQLVNPKVEITSIAADIMAKEPDDGLLNNQQYIQNIQYRVKPQQKFNHWVQIGVAKHLLKDKGLDVRKLMDKNDKTLFTRSIKTSKNNDQFIRMKYTTKNSYSTWVTCKIKAVSPNQITIELN